jgi:arylsulfatase
MLRTLAGILLIGLGAGAAAGKWQIAALRFGDIAADQTGAYWGFFLGAGAALAAAGAALGAAVAAALRRRARPACVLGAVLASAVGFAVFVPRNARDLPHVFLLVTDTTRADHLSLYGYERPTTPFLQEMAARSVVFTNSVSQGSHTIVTTPSLLASVYPSDHGLIDYAKKLWEGHLLVSEILSFQGYATVGVVTNPHLSRRNGFDQGFDAYEMLGSGTFTPIYAARVNARALAAIDSLRAAGSPADSTADSSRATSGTDRPVFAFLFYTDPHTPYQSPEKYRTLYDPDWKADPVYVWNTKSQGDPAPDVLYNLIAQYDATITYWDDQLRALSESLAVRGMLDDALFVYTSDHGEEFWEHGEIGHGHSLFEETVHVPLVLSLPVPVRFPRLPRTARVVDEVVSSVDVLPTVLDYLRVPVSHRMRGRSALPPALGHPDPGPERSAYLEQILEKYGSFDIRALRTRDRKFVSVRKWETTFRDPWARGDLLFDLEEDPGETANLLEERPDEARRLRVLLEQAVAKAEAEARGASEVSLDAEHLERLEALGYIE